MSKNFRAQVLFHLPISLMFCVEFFIFYLYLSGRQLCLISGSIFNKYCYFTEVEDLFELILRTLFFFQMTVRQQRVHITCMGVWRKSMSRARSLILIGHCTNTQRCHLIAVLQKQWMNSVNRDSRQSSYLKIMNVQVTQNNLQKCTDGLLCYLHWAIKYIWN